MGGLWSCLKGENDQEFSRPNKRRVGRNRRSDRLSTTGSLADIIPSKILKSDTVDGQLQSITIGKIVTSEDVSGSSRLSNGEKYDFSGKLESDSEQKSEVRTFSGSNTPVMKQQSSYSMEPDMNVISVPTDSDDSLMEDISHMSLSDINSKNVDEPISINEGTIYNDSYTKTGKDQGKERSQANLNLIVTKKRMETQSSLGRKNTPIVEHILPVHTQVKNFEHIEAESKRNPSQYQDNSFNESHTNASIEELVDYYQRLDQEANIDSEVLVKNGQVPDIERKLGTRIALAAKNYGRLAEIE